jgi:signal transduction histidine kinase
MIAGGAFFYSAVRTDIYNQIDNSLITEKELIQDQIEQTETVPDFLSSFGHMIEVKLLDFKPGEEMYIKDTLLNDTVSGTNLSYRYLYFSGETSKNKGYTIAVLKLLDEKQDLLEAVGLYLIGLFLSLLLISILLNYFISKKLWSPFYKSVENAGSFDVISGVPLDLPSTEIIEFQQLNNVFEKMTQKMRTDYLNLKEYNENAAHEIQTPLAIIRSKMELLMQNKNMKKEDLNHINSINEATSRLFKLNQGLLLISKIQNQFFHENKEISLKEIIQSSLDNYREILELKKIKVEFKASNEAIVNMNETLADVLISNLLSNAVRYNIDNGFIKCYIDEKSILFINSGLPLKTDPESLFRRFNKGSNNPQSVGLGLSIVRKITDTYNMQISYICDGNIHQLKLNYRY